MTAPISAAEAAAATTGEGFDELAVANASFFIDKLGRRSRRTQPPARRREGDRPPDRADA